MIQNDPSGHYFVSPPDGSEGAWPRCKYYSIRRSPFTMRIYHDKIGNFQPAVMSCSDLVIKAVLES